MKARQIAIALNSIYAIDPHHQIQAIERDFGGLWDGGSTPRFVP